MSEIVTEAELWEDWNNQRGEPRTRPMPPFREWILQLGFRECEECTRYFQSKNTPCYTAKLCPECRRKGKEDE